MPKIISGFRHSDKIEERKFYAAWQAAIYRCHSSQKGRDIRNYQDKGITVCARWRDSFLNFKEDMFETYLTHLKVNGVSQTSLDRADNSRGYFPDNCRWTTYINQGRNRDDNRLITYRGTTQCLSAWAQSLGLNFSTLSERLNKQHWSLDQVMCLPLLKKGTGIKNLSI